MVPPTAMISTSRISPTVSKSIPSGPWLLLLQLRHNLRRNLSRLVQLPGRETDCAYPRVAAAAVAFADRGQVMPGHFRRPGVRTHRDLRAEAGRTNRHGVKRGGKQVVGNKLVVALHIVARQIEEDHAVGVVRAPLDDVLDFQVAPVERLVERLDFPLCDDLRKLHTLHPGDRKSTRLNS